MTFQNRVGLWVEECFGKEIAQDKVERNHRFLEEALELVQSLGLTAEEAHLLVHYVYNRPPGVPTQELGGVMVTLAALCYSYNGALEMTEDGQAELDRINQPHIKEKIRIKQQNKPKHSPLPE
jgi:hypothetical protein